MNKREREVSKHFIDNMLYLQGALPYRKQEAIKKKGIEEFKLHGLSELDALELVDLNQHIMPYFDEEN